LALLLVSSVADELGDLQGEVVGIGAITAAARMASILATKRPDKVLLVGTASAYPGGPELGGVVTARRVGTSASVAVMGLGYVPRPPNPLICDPFILHDLGLDSVDVLTASAVTTDSVLAGRLSDGWQIEQMEAFGVALACAQADVPFAGIFGIASLAGPEAHVQWLSHRSEAQEAARRAIASLFISA
jgi:nucleoside phosphorylase